MIWSVFKSLLRIISCHVRDDLLALPLWTMWLDPVNVIYTHARYNSSASCCAARHLNLIPYCTIRIKRSALCRILHCQMPAQYFIWYENTDLLLLLSQKSLELLEWLYITPSCRVAKMKWDMNSKWDWVREG